MKKQYAVNVETAVYIISTAVFCVNILLVPDITSLAELHTHTATREIGIEKAPGVVAEC
jgi:hypothetical protein